MSEQQQPELPEGAIPTEIDAVPQDAVRIDAADVQSTVETMIADGDFGEEEPLPVGANDPEVLADQPADPPGMPHKPDDLDREMAGYVQDYNDQHMWEVHLRAPRLRPDQATIHDARSEVIHDNIKPRSVRQALLVHAQQMAAAQREAAMAYARALVEVQETRDLYVAAREALSGAEEALFAMGLDIEEDHEVVEPTEAPAPIPDSAIV